MMAESMAEKSTRGNGETAPLDAGLSLLWEKAEAAVALIGRLRQENRSLKDQVASLTLEIGKLRGELEELRSNGTGAAPADGREGSFLAEADRDAMVNRVKDLLSRIDEYL